MFSVAVRFLKTLFFVFVRAWLGLLLHEFQNQWHEGVEPVRMNAEK